MKSKTLIFLFGFLLCMTGLTASFAQARTEVIQPAELQRMLSIISFLKSKLSGEDSYDAADPSVKLDALITSLELFGLTVNNRENLSPDLKATDLAIAILGSTPPRHRQVAIADLTAFLGQLPAYKVQPIEPNVPRGAAITSLGRQPKATPKQIEKPKEVEKYFNGKKRTLHDLLEREVKKQAAIARAEQKKASGTSKLKELMDKVKAHRETLMEDASEEDVQVPEPEPVYEEEMEDTDAEVEAEVFEEPVNMAAEQEKRKETISQMLAKVRKHRENLVEDIYSQEEEVEEQDEPTADIQTSTTAEKVAKVKSLLSDLRSKVGKPDDFVEYGDEPNETTSEIIELETVKKPEKPVLPKTPYEDSKGKKWLVGPEGHSTSTTKVEIPEAHN